jgi:mannose-6-phosphate isomerase-like protein (cupin superfamily)
MDVPGHYRFATEALEPLTAHGGHSPIWFRRVVELGPRSSCNFIDFSLVPPGGEIGVHTHAADNEEIYIVLEGEGQMYMDGARFAIQPGDVIVNRPSGTHGLWNHGPANLKLVVIEIPAGAARHA